MSGDGENTVQYWSPEDWERETENRIWREFACAALAGLATTGKLKMRDDVAEVAELADVMLIEAKARGRV